ncbi:MAG: hypothetical protein LUD12_12210 [Lachnospiraceae bacterium]|nr:hypothetical protein [Lachnospiraceae bacterium]
MSKHYFFLILNTYTHQSRYEHGCYKDVEDIKKYLGEDDHLVTVWEVGDKVY